MADLKQICAHIRELGNQQETPELRAEVEAAFASKWEGVQVVAARVLGHWGGRRSVELLKSWLLNFYKHGRGYAVEQAATEGLSECFEAEDVTWMLDIYFEEPRIIYFDRIIRKISIEIGQEIVQERILNEMKHPEPRRRYKALIVMRIMMIFAACPMITELELDPDASVRILAQSLSKTFCP